MCIKKALNYLFLILLLIVIIVIIDNSIQIY